MVNEVLTKMTPLETWIDDFVHSKNAKFAGKSTAERISMAKGAYYAKQRRESVEEAAAVSQNTSAEVSMNEDHLVHVSDGSKYDDKPHPKDVEYVMAGIKKHGGEHAGASDKGAFFKFKSKDDAENFKSYTNKCPHRSCDAEHVTEAVEYKGIGTDVVDKKKKLNPQPNFTTDKKQVKDFKEEVELIDELDKKTIGSYAKKATKDLKWQQTMRPFDAKRISNREKGIDKAIDKLTKEEVQINESSLHRQHFQMVADLIRGHESAEKRKELAHHHAELFKKANPRFDHAKFMKAAGVNEEVELIAKHEVKADAPHKTSGHVILTKSSDKWHVLHNKKSSPDAKDLHRSKLLHSYDDEKAARAKFKELKEEQIDEISKSTLMRYIPAAARAAAQHTYSGKEAQAWAGHHMRAGDYAASDRQLATSKSELGKSLKRIKGVDTATKKLGTKKTYEQFIYALEEKEIEDNEPVCAICGDEKGTKHSCCDEVKFMPKHEYDSYNEKPKKVNEAIAKKLPVQHAVDAVHATLGPKSATRFLSHLTPGSDKHTTWDKVNDALVKQGVQTHHIASIAQKTSRMNEEVIDESRGHKVLATFFKNREVAQRSYQGNPAKDAEVAQGGGSPADQGIAAAKRDAEELKKKVSEATAPAVHAAEPKKTKSTPKEYASAAIPGTKRVAHAKPDDNEVGGGTATRIAEDQYTSEYKIKQFVDPVTGENKTRKIRPHRINFKSSKMNAAPAQMTEPTKVTEDDKVYDEKWKKVKFTDFIKGAK